MCVRICVRACMRVCTAVCVYVLIDHHIKELIAIIGLCCFRRLAGSSRTPPYLIKLDLRDGRPDLPGQGRRRRELHVPTPREEFLTSTSIRVVFYGQPLGGDSHIVPEMSVYTR